MFIVTIDQRQKPHRGGISGSMPLLRSLVALPFHCYKHAAPLGLGHVIVLMADVYTTCSLGIFCHSQLNGPPQSHQSCPSCRLQRHFDKWLRTAIGIDMSVATEKLEREIKKLPVNEMVSIHERLIATIHEKADAEGLDPDFRAEIEQRVKEIDAGTEKGVDAFRVLRKM